MAGSESSLEIDIAIQRSSELMGQADEILEMFWGAGSFDEL